MQRAQLIKVINVGRAQLGWDDDLYRGTLARFGGRADADGRVSLKTLDDGQMRALLAHMRGAGFADQRKDRPRNMEALGREVMTKIEALLADTGKPWSYADSILRTQTRGRKMRLAFANGDELHAVLVALERHNLKVLSAALGDVLKREGWTWRDAGYAAELLFGFRSRSRELTRYNVFMGNLLRWFRGEVAPFCHWPRGE